MKLYFDNSYAKLPASFYSNTNPTPVSNPKLVQFNTELADELGLTKISQSGSNALKLFAGNEIPVTAIPISMAYAGHQFGGFSPQLGDGRAVLLGEIISPNNIRYDFQLKGAGRTPWSRSGDGRSALGPVLREYLVSEAMAKLGVPTTRALAAVVTGEQVMRSSPVLGGVLTRLSTGFVRVGTFQYFSHKGDSQAIKLLADYEIERHYPSVKFSDNPYIAFFKAVVDKHAQLIAKWMSLGFIHGVMNTDNMSIAGETLDYGPCAFMDGFSHEQVFSSIDANARYAYNKQSDIGQWNLTRFAETLLPLFFDKSFGKNIDKSLDEKRQVQEAIAIAQTILSDYKVWYQNYWIAEMRQKLGLKKSQVTDSNLIEELLDCMDNSQADFTLTFYYLSQLNDKADEEADKNDQALIKLFFHSDKIENWLKKWRIRLVEESLSQTERQKLMAKVNPVYIPRNHQIEKVIRAAEDHGDFDAFYALNDILKAPFTAQKGKSKYMMPPLPNEVVHQTFCGT